MTIFGIFHCIGISKSCKKNRYVGAIQELPLHRTPLINLHSYVPGSLSPVHLCLSSVYLRKNTPGVIVRPDGLVAGPEGVIAEVGAKTHGVSVSNMS